MNRRSELGQGIRRRRLDLGIGEKRIADALGVPTLQVGRWERGEEVPAAEQVRVLIDLLDPPADQARVWLDGVSPTVVAVELASRPEPAPVAAPGPAADPWSVPPERRITAPRLDREALVVRSSPIPAPAPPAPPPGMAPSLDRLLKREARRDERRLRRYLTASERAGQAEAAAEARLQASHRAGAARSTPGPRPRPVAAPAGAANTGVVFPVPDTRKGSERVTYEGMGEHPEADDRLTYLVRRTATAAILVALAGLLWWAFGSLGDGFGAVLDLLRGGGEAPEVAGLMLGL